MQLKDILAKVAKGDALTDDEKSFLGSYDPQAAIDTAAAAARKAAEKEAKTHKDALAALQAEFDQFKADNDPTKNRDANAKLLARVEKLEADKKAAEAKAAAMERTAKVRELAKAAGINAAKGVDSKTIDLLVDNLMHGVDIEDADAVKTAFDGFKTANAGLIAAPTVSGAGVKGIPGAEKYAGKNPFAKETYNLTEQFVLKQSNPELANALQQEAASATK